MGYFDGIGVYSYPEINQAARGSGLIGPDPLLRDTSDLRSMSEGYSYHATGNAVDFGDDAPNGSPQQDQFAKWVAANYGPYSLEIIHVYQNGDTEEWKMGLKMPTGWYGAATLAEHHNHVHWAITKNGLFAADQIGAIDIMAAMRTMDVGMPDGKGGVLAGTGTPLKMDDPLVRTAQALLEARGGLINAANTDHGVFAEVLHWFHVATGLADEGIYGPETWQRVVLPLNGR